MSKKYELGFIYGGEVHRLIDFKSDGYDFVSPDEVMIKANDGLGVSKCKLFPLLVEDEPQEDIPLEPHYLIGVIVTSKDSTMIIIDNNWGKSVIVSLVSGLKINGWDVTRASIMGTVPKDQISFSKRFTQQVDHRDLIIHHPVEMIVQSTSQEKGAK